MKLRTISQLLLLLVAMLMLSLPVISAEVESNYGHVSFVENQTTIIRADQAEDQAVVNLPLVPGDTIVTATDGRCELQFDNGTVIRLDKNTSLRITIVQAPTLTSRWKVTTLHLLQGQLYTLPQTYGTEMFQIITSNAAVKLESRTAATIRFGTDLSTTLFSDAGKFEVLYGADSKNLEKIKVKSGQAYVINSANVLAASSEKRNLDFVAWNEYVDRHFKELHSGISKLPPKLEFENSTLQQWAMQWSPVYGEWIYNDIFGYVWRPFSDAFARFDRPFFNGKYLRINGSLFLVPQETWGWVPAHMGTWVWLKRGWTWVPGSYFHSGVFEFFAENGCFFPSFNYYFMFLYGDYDLWNVYYRYGRKAWQEEYYRKYPEKEKMPPPLDLLDRFPDELKKAFKRINHSPITIIGAWLKPSLEQSGLDAKKILLPAVSPQADSSDKRPKSITPVTGTENLSQAPVPDAEMSDKGKIRTGGELKSLTKRDWNPDRGWADARGYTIQYSSSRNAVVCPELNISSDRGQLRNQAGADRFAVPGRGSFPENSPQPGAYSPGGNAGVTGDQARGDGAEKKENDNSRK
jgi:hypothetical protein